MVDGPVRDAAVLVAIVMREQPMLLLTQRTSAMRSHAGQVAFAGGKVDATDADAVAAALREAHEEIGLHSDHVEVLGCLPSYTTGSAFRITPVVALVDASHVLSLSAGEVAEAFEVPLAFLMNPAHHLRHRVVWDFGQGPLAREWFSMPYPAVGVDTPTPSGQDRFIWGATAGMLRNLYAFLVVPQVS